MKEFMSLLISFIFMGIADSIDKAFGNSISLDAVVVVGCTASIGQATKSLSRLGTYAYRVIRKNELKCIQLDAIAGAIIGFLVFLFKDNIVSLYALTDIQRELFLQVLGQWALYLPMYAVGNASFELVRLNNKLKLYNKGLVLFYTVEILSDAFVYTFTKSLPLLYFTTSICQIIATIYFLNKARFEYEWITLQFIKDALPYGIATAIERFMNGIAYMVYGVFASRMSSFCLAIHSVCIGAITTSETITNAYGSALMIKVPLNGDFDSINKEIRKWGKRLFGLMLILYAGYSFLSLYISKGNVLFCDLFPWSIFYMLAFFGLFLCESMKVLCINLKYVKVLPLGVTIGLLFRLSVAWVGLSTNYPLIFFGLASSFDWAIRGVVYYIAVNRANHKSGDVF